MKKKLWVRIAVPSLLFAFVITTSQCTQPQTANRSANQEVPTPSSSFDLSLPPLKDGVVLNVIVHEDQGRRPTVAGETNLPDGTEGIASIQSKTTKKEGSDQFTVQGGRFEAGPFSNGGQGLDPGNYTMDVTIAIAQIQPPQVKAIIGQSGENLHGPLVERGGIGTSVRMTQDFQLGERGEITAGTYQVAVNKYNQAPLKQARAVLQAIQKLERQGRDMETLRGDNVEKLRQCGDLMRARQSEAKALRARAETLPRERYALLLAAAAGDLYLCVSCTSKATDYCNIARGSLNDAVKDLNQKDQK